MRHPAGEPKRKRLNNEREDVSFVLLRRKFFSRLTSIEMGLWEEKLSIHVPPLTTSFRSRFDVECLGVKDTILQINGWQSKRNNYLNIFMALVEKQVSYLVLTHIHAYISHAETVTHCCWTYYVCALRPENSTFVYFKKISCTFFFSFQTK